jgi:hypothetical protein
MNTGIPLSVEPNPCLRTANRDGVWRVCTRRRKSTVLYVVEIRRERPSMTMTMSNIREWLDGQRFEPDAFRCTTDTDAVTFRLEFKSETEAKACARTFEGRLISLGPAK